MQAARKANGVSASPAQNSGTHTESTPSRSASRTSSTPAGPSGLSGDADSQGHRAVSASGLDALDGALHVGPHLVEPSAQHPRLLAGVGVDGHRGARRTRSHRVAEPQPGAAAGRFEVEPPAGPGLSGSEVRQPNGVGLVARVDEARDRPLADRRVLVAPDRTRRPPRARRPAHSAPTELLGEAGRRDDVGDERPHDAPARRRCRSRRSAPGTVLEAEALARTRLERGAEPVEVGDRPRRMPRRPVERRCPWSTPPAAARSRSCGRGCRGSP